MTRNSTELPQGAGATTTTTDRNDASRRDADRAETGRIETGRIETGRVETGRRETGSRETYAGTTSHDIVISENRGRPSTATVVGAALAGAVAGAAIPFMFAGRSSGRVSSSSDRSEETVVHETVIINRPARQLYDFWRNFENLPQFMDNVKSVEKLDAVRSHWVIKAPAGTSVSFDSRVVDDVPGRSISWESEEGASVPNRGRVEFIETASGASTNVLVTLSYDPPAGAAGRAIAKLFQREPSVQAREDLQRLKRLMEGGAA